MDRNVEMDPTGQNAQDQELRETSSLLDARRKFLTGSLSMTAFAATLSSRKAYAWNGGGHGPITDLCSPQHSHVSGGKSCVGYHQDKFCQDISQWGGLSCKSHTFAACGWSSPSGCSINSSQRLSDAFNTCYKQQSGQSWSGQNCNMSQWSKWDTPDSPCGVFQYDSSCDASSKGVAGWVACGLINCQNPGPSWYYSADSFISACQRVYQSKCVGNPDQVLCQLLSSLCSSGRRSQGCGGSSSVWNNW